MKIGQHDIDDAEAITGTNEETAVATKGLELAIGGGGLQTPHTGGANRNDPSARLARQADAFACILADLQPFGMHDVPVEVIHPHGLEGACPDMQRDLRPSNAQFSQALQHGCIEMQSGCGRRDRTLTAGIEGLIAGIIGLVIRPLNIGGQRNVTLSGHDVGEGRFDRMQTEQITLATGQHQARAIGELDDRSRPGRLAGADMGERLVRRQQTFDQDLDPSAGRLLTEQPGAHDAGVIEDEQVIRAQQARQIGEDPVARAVLRAIKNQHPCPATLSERALGNQFGRKIVIKVRALH